MIPRLIIGLLLLFPGIATHAQNPWGDDSTSVSIGTSIHYGSIFPHSRAVRHISVYNPYGIQAEVARTRFTQRSWNACNCYSQNGIALQYMNFGNPDTLGSSVSLMLFAEPQLTYGSTELRFRAGMGISYLTRVFHPERNPENIFFSRNISGLLLVQLNVRRWLTRSWALTAGATYQHISNGGSREPNLGMNFGTIALGGQYVLNPIIAQGRTKRPLLDRSVHYYIGFAGNSRSVPNTQNMRKMVVGFQGGFYKPFARMHGAGLGVEVVRDGSIKELSRSGADDFRHYIYAVMVRHHLIFGRFDFSQAAGFYLRAYPSTHQIFQRYAMDYRVIQNLRVGFSLKAHLHVAEQMDIRATFLF